MAFQDKVFKIVKEIPKGCVATYRQVADKLGSPNKARAVGNALNKNRDFKNIPCHRVVKTNGEVGGYAKGADLKAKKLLSEGVVIKNYKIVSLEKYLYNYN